jgi:hypothetical protein
MSANKIEELSVRRMSPRKEMRENSEKLSVLVEYCGLSDALFIPLVSFQLFKGAHEARRQLCLRVVFQRRAFLLEARPGKGF